MHNTARVLLLVMLVMIYSAFAVRRALQTGRARVWPGGWVTRKGQPGKYWRNVYGSFAVLGLSAVTVIAILIWPDAFR